MRAIGLPELTSSADVISLHVPLVDATRGLFDAARIGAMKKGAVLINSARGGVVDEAALAAALQSGRVGAAGVDVFDEEPPSHGSPLFACDNAVLSPHIAGLTEECGERMAIASIRNALDYLDGTIAPQLIVNSEALNA